MILLSLALAAATPAPEVERLGRQLAESGTLAAILPLMKQKEIEELVSGSGLDEAGKADLRATAERVFEQGRDRLMTATAKAYAERLSAEDLRQLVAFEQTDAAKRYRAAVPGAIAATMQAVGQMDFKKDVRAAFCREKGKLCENK
jgi:hypothetical protein